MNEYKRTIQQVAQETGLSEYTLRYYERVGLIHPIGRAENSHRRYSQDDLEWIEFLKKLRATGMSIQQMVDYAELQRQGEETIEQRLEMLKALRSQLESCIGDLQEHLEVICDKIELYQGIIDRCYETP